jgi:hypothetical protein
LPIIGSPSGVKLTEALLLTLPMLSYLVVEPSACPLEASFISALTTEDLAETGGRRRSELSPVWRPFSDA